MKGDGTKREKFGFNPYKWSLATEMRCTSDQKPLKIDTTKTVIQSHSEWNHLNINIKTVLTFSEF